MFQNAFIKNSKVSSTAANIYNGYTCFQIFLCPLRQKRKPMVATPGLLYAIPTFSTLRLIFRIAFLSPVMI